MNIRLAYLFSSTHRLYFLNAHQFAGNIVPVLNKLLASGGYSRERDNLDRAKSFGIVRVEVSNAADLNADMPQSVSPEEQKNSEVFLEADPVVGDQDDIGQGVAREITNKTSKVRFRGKITKYHDNNRNSHLGDPSGSFFVNFSDGRKLEMDAEQVNHARRKFEKEVNRLVSCGMPREDASSIEEQTKGASLSKTRIRKPILHDEEVNPHEFERNFEQEYLDVVPSSIVGLIFHREDFYELLLERLSERLMKMGTETTRSLCNLEKLEKAEAQNKEDEMM